MMFLKHTCVTVAGMQAGWYAVGGRQLICRREMKTTSSELRWFGVRCFSV